eukprot:TRINITY_DN563_c0_g2_i4.p2 TRINITY_DN563_c0_g2~~TRINITY_DN563_c0_g2_i4.p2  ORF type:complete len:139 (+),score=29.43 TRINITY_DN563_c0_g2_i4:42-458(+)
MAVSLVLAGMCLARSMSGCADLQLSHGTAWHDADGPRYGCSWYATQQRCLRFGRSYRNKHVAQEACCVCEGGSRSTAAAPPSVPVSVDNTTAPVEWNMTSTPPAAWNGTYPSNNNATWPSWNATESGEWNATYPLERD